MNAVFPPQEQPGGGEGSDPQRPHPGGEGVWGSGHSGRCGRGGASRALPPRLTVWHPALILAQPRRLTAHRASSQPAKGRLGVLGTPPAPRGPAHLLGLRLPICAHRGRPAARSPSRCPGLHGDGPRRPLEEPCHVLPPGLQTARAMGTLPADSRGHTETFKCHSRGPVRAARCTDTGRHVWVKASIPYQPCSNQSRKHSF